ncbi:MAG: hypothetical protein ACODAU_07815 [Myxococcota bacterium]
MGLLLGAGGFGCSATNEVDWDRIYADPDVGIEVQLEPAKAVYRPQDEVTVRATATDPEGAQVEDVDVHWEVRPAGAASRGDGRTWVLESEGEVTFVGCAQTAEGDARCGQATVLVDAGPPAVTLTRPSPGEELLESESPVIAVEGTAEDTHGEPRVFVNGTPTSVDAQGRFQAEVEPRFGVNHIVVEATDGVNDEATTRELDVLWARDYLAPVAGGVGFDLSDALLLRVGQRFFDDKVPLDETDPPGARDLAGVLEVVLRQADLLALVPDPVVDSSSVQLSATRIDVGDVLIDIDLRDGRGLEVFVTLVDAEIGTEGFASFAGQSYDLTGVITGTLSLFGRLEITESGGAYQVDLVEAQTFVDRISGDLEDPFAQVLFDVLTTALRQQIDEALHEQITPMITEPVPGLLEDALASVVDGLSGISFPLDTGLGPALSVELGAALEEMEIVPGGYGQLGASLSAAVDVTPLGGGTAEPIHSDSRGAAMIDPAPAPTFSSRGRLQLAARLDLINALLHGLWNAGLLRFSGDDLVQGAIVNVDGQLPPVVRPAYPEEPFDLVAELGQLQVEVDLGAESGTFGVSARAGATVELVDGALAVVIQTNPDVTVWSLGEEPTGPLLTVNTLESLIASSVWPSLFESIGGGITLEIPLPNLADLGLEGVEGELLLVQRHPVDGRGGYLRLDADLVLGGPDGTPMIESQ